MKMKVVQSRTPQVAVSVLQPYFSICEKYGVIFSLQKFLCYVFCIISSMLFFCSYFLCSNKNNQGNIVRVAICISFSFESITITLQMWC